MVKKREGGERRSDEGVAVEERKRSAELNDG